MGRHDDGGTCVKDGFKDIDYVLARDNIQISGRFICNDNFRIVEDGSGNGNSLLFSARKFMWKIISLVSQFYNLEHFFDTVSNVILLFPSCSFQNEFKIFGHCSVWQQLKILKDDTQSFS